MEATMDGRRLMMDLKLAKMEDLLSYVEAEGCEVACALLAVQQPQQGSVAAAARLDAFLEADARTRQHEQARVVLEIMVQQQKQVRVELEARMEREREADRTMIQLLAQRLQVLDQMVSCSKAEIAHIKQTMGQDGMGV